ncbi:MAG: hypothetical protein GF349_00635 [Candidatus Magasanikbacteria bacterium]|nr:hypothetical protein [Candidatus Magasanikbacteria bacterium]
MFWVPRLAEDSTDTTANSMKQHEEYLWQKHDLPETHCGRFGPVALLFGLILAHLRRTGERVPLNSRFACSNTLDPSGDRFIVGGFEGGYGLQYRLWGDGGRFNDVGFFLLGVDYLRK